MGHRVFLRGGVHRCCPPPFQQLSAFCRKRPPAPDPPPAEGDSSPPPGARRRFSALLEPGPPRNGVPTRDGPTEGAPEEPGGCWGGASGGGGCWGVPVCPLPPPITSMSWGGVLGGPYVSPPPIISTSFPLGDRVQPPPRTELGLRRPRHPGVTPEGGADKRSPRGPGKVTKSASATALSVIIPSGEWDPPPPPHPPGGHKGGQSTQGGGPPGMWGVGDSAPRVPKGDLVP